MGGSRHLLSRPWFPAEPQGSFWYTSRVTAKEALHEHVDRLSEAEAEEWLLRMEWESTETEELTAAERRRWLEGKHQIAAGDWVDAEELFADLNR